MNAECCICIANITDPGDSAASGSAPDYPVATKCGHLFHHSCLSTWLKQKSVCPSCKDTVRKTSYFRIFLDAGEDAGTAEEPVDVDGSDPAAVRRARAESRRYAMLEEEVENTRKALDVARSKMEEAEEKAQLRQSKINEQRRIMSEQDLVHGHDKAEAANWKRKYDRLHDEHATLSDQAEKWRVIHDQRAKAEKIANEDADFDPAIDRPEVLKWANKQLVNTKSELKRQLLELRAENERLQKAADAAKKRLDRQKEKDRERRAKEKGRDGGGSRGSGGGSRHRAVAAPSAAVAAAAAEDLLEPLGGLLPPRRESSKTSSLSQQQSDAKAPVQSTSLLSHSLVHEQFAPAGAEAAADEEAENSMAFEPPASPELTDEDGSGGGGSSSSSSDNTAAAAAQHGAATRAGVEEGAPEEDTEWAAALLQEESQGAWVPSPAASRTMARTKTLVTQAHKQQQSQQQSQQQQPRQQPQQSQQSQQRRHQQPAPIFGFAGAAAAPSASSGSVGMASHPVNRPVPAEFRSWTATAGSRRGKQQVSGAGTAAASASAAAAAAKGPKGGAKRMRMSMLSSGRGHTPKVSSFFK